MGWNGKGGNYDTKRYYGSPTYATWFNMKTRCRNKNNDSYQSYGKRGIRVCEEWANFSNFLRDMGEKPAEKSLDRVNNNGNYCKENCRWATAKEQANNTRNIDNACKFILNNEMLTINQLAQKFNIKRTTLGMRLLKYGWSLEKSLRN